MTLYLLPNFLSKESPNLSLMPGRLFDRLSHLSGLIVESPKGAALFISGCRPHLQKKEMPWVIFREKEIDFLLEPLLKGESWGFVSDAGLPCIADPGALLVHEARKRKIPVEAIPGPSSIFLALMLSGLSSQSFCFHGYLEKGGEKNFPHYQKDIVHLFIEAPFRNEAFFQLLLTSLPENSTLCVARGLTSSEEWVQTKKISSWRKEQAPSLNNIPTVFLFKFYAHRSSTPKTDV